ncbi:glycosidase [Deinobacterium chartae]|uniref:alpha-amylase n=1 Tax=Deinobacterium chartae TaxID=521158 RepID=A0A841HYG2_9DEIO|nr:alpha-amylase family glycosyl hydrolase [Deinobacterium chartae]MBB6097923.1 glycosidase [Deinobacterium chartae]
MKRVSLIVLTLALAACGQTPQPPAAEPAESVAESVAESPGLSAQAFNPLLWQQQVIYLAIPDRFHNGNPNNDKLGANFCLDAQWPLKFHGGDLAGLRQKLPYLKDLGVTTVWTTPLYRQVPEFKANTPEASCGYHGYWADFDQNGAVEVEPKLGTAADVDALIQDLHARGMRYMMDMVVNHAGYNARIVTQKPEWFHANCMGDDVNCPLAELPDFKHESNEVANYLTHLSRNWAKAFDIDAIRMDTVKQVPLDYWKNSWVPGMRAEKPDLFLLGEAFLQDSAAQLKPYLDAGFDSTFAMPLQRTMVEVFAKEGSTNLLADRLQDTLSTLGLQRALLQVNLLDNHDVPRFLNEPGLGVPEEEIRRRYQLGLGALFTLPGVPQLFYGNEVGLYGGKDPDNRRDMPKWAWTEAERTGINPEEALPDPQATFGLTKKLIEVRKKTPALYRGYYAEMWRANGGANVFAFYRGSGTSRVIVVFNNGAVSSGDIAIPVSANTGITSSDRTAMSAFTGRTFKEVVGTAAPDQVQITEGVFKINLPPKTFGIYVQQQQAKKAP